MEESFEQNAKWFYIAALLASVNGGYVNAITFESFFHNPVGYVTGNITFAASFLADGKIVNFFDLLLVLASFLMGAILSGLIIPHAHNIKVYRYKVAFWLEYSLISMGMVLLINNVDFGKYFLALALGLQNGVTTFYGKSIIRTTHMTGTMTDLGIMISHALIKRYNVSMWKIHIYIILLCGFFIGSVSGVLAFEHIGYYGLIFSCTICLCMIKISNLRHV